MKKKLLKKLLAFALIGVFAIGMLAGCDEGKGGQADTGNELESLIENPVTGKILYMSNTKSGPQYDYYIACFTDICDKLGYKLEVIYGDAQNDPAGNLKAVKDAYTSDVVGLIMGQDGGVIDILNEYPDLYVCGFMTDMAAVYDENGTSHAALENPHFLGSMGDNYISGADTAKDFFDIIVEKGYKNISIIKFPVFAYPQHTVADETLRGLIDEYNATAKDADKITVVGDSEVLMFSPLSADYFMDASHQNLDAIVGICAGTQFIYPTMLDAIVSGSCSADTKLLTGGLELEVLDDCGDDKTIGSIRLAMPDSCFWPIVMLDSAIQGVMFDDWTTAERLSSGVLTADTTEEFEAMKANCPFIDADLSKNIYSWTDVQKMMPRYNADATYADLCTKLTTDISIENYMK